MTATQEPLDRNQRIALASTAVVVAVTRLFALAKGPWDWDEVLFCLAVGDYNVAAHQPHPPGFPLYIFLARLVRLVADSDFHALQTLNVIAAMLVFPVVFAVARAFRFDFVLSLWAAFLFAFLPNVWFYGGTAFSDLPAMVLYLGAIAAFLFAWRNGKASTYLLASVVLAAGIMVRPQNAVVALFPWFMATVSLVRAKRVRTAIAGAATTIALTVAGYGIAAYVTGFQDYVNAVYWHSQFVRKTDSVSAAFRPPFHRVLAMMLDPYQAGKVSIVINLLMLTGIVYYALERGRRAQLRDILLTFGPFFLFAALAVNPLGSSRFSLNWICGVALLAALGVSAIASVVPRYRALVLLATIAALSGRLIPWTLPAFEEPRKHDSPPVAAAKWVEANVPHDATVFVDESIWPWARYYVSTHRQERPRNPLRVVSDPKAEFGVYLTMDPVQVRAERVFTRPRNRTWNLVTQRAFEAYVVPARAFVIYDNGWWGQEGQWPDVWRWSSKRATIRFAPMKHPGELRMKFEVYKRPVHVRLTLNGQPLPTFVATEPINELRYVVQPRGDIVNVLKIEVQETFTPSRLDPNDHDWRQLGIMLHEWDVRPLAAPELRKAG